MGKKSSSAGDKLRSAAYKTLDRAKANAKRRIERHLKKHPQDEQAQAALTAVGSRTYRTKPNVKGGWVKEGLRAAMIYVPYLTAKGQPIPAKTPDQLSAMLRTHSQNIPLTRTNVKGYAQMLRFTAVSDFHQVPVVETRKVGGFHVPVVVMKHLSKLSNYKGDVAK